MKKAIIWVSVMAVVFICGAVVQADVKRGGVLTYGIAASSVTVGVDPHVIQGSRTGWVLGLIAEGLLNYDKGLNPVPWLAKSWDISSDGTQYTFYLEKGVKFHTGREMTAGDVKYSLERIIEPKTGSRRRKNLEIIRKIDTIDLHTVRITL